MTTRERITRQKAVEQKLMVVRSQIKKLSEARNRQRVSVRDEIDRQLPKYEVTRIALEAELEALNG